jgi:hypothetical protein
MAQASQDTRQKVRELSRLKHLMNPWESHVRGKDGPNDNGGFMEGMEVAIERGWEMTEKRLAIVNRMYDKFILKEGTAEATDRTSPTRSDAFTVGNIEGVRSSEGWRLKIDGVLIGTPTIREHAYIIATWLESSLGSIEHFFQGAKPAPDSEGAKNEVDEL